MAEARKRAKNKAEKAAPAAPPAEATSGTAVPIDPREDTEAPAAAEEPEADLVFPAEPAPVRSGHFQLPASGTAEEILARAEAASLAPAPEEDAIARAVRDATTLSEPQKAASISFFSAPAREERAAAEATEHLATFYLDREEYGVEVKLVQEIRRLTVITPVPRAPEFIRGVINLRGRIIPVVDLKKKLGLGEVQEGRAARIVVVKIQERLVGMMVDGASQVLKVPVSSVEPAPDEVVEKGGDYIRGVAKLDKRLIILVDLHRILLLDGADGSAPEAGERSA
ncbi:MAG TPA: chemotaxis protein CheW [Vicinamibacteria bacterium]